MYIGQKIFFYPLSDIGKSRVKTSSDFLLHEPQIAWINTDKRKPKEGRDYLFVNNYGWDISDMPYFTTRPESVFGHYFYIKDFKYVDKKLIFTLLEERSNVLLDWILRDHTFISGLPIIISSYYDRMRDTYVGNEFYVFKVDKTITYLNSDKQGLISPSAQAVFKCIDIGLTDGGNYKIPSLIFEDKEGNLFPVKIDENFSEIFFSIYPTNSSKDLNNFISRRNFRDRKIIDEENRKRRAENEAKKEAHLRLCVEKFGKELGTIIASGQIHLGMTCEMCELALGKPDHTNISYGKWGLSEQWVYDNGTYLYFENDRLDTVQY